MKFNKLRETAFEEIQFNAGVLTEEFEPSTGTLALEKIIGQTSGGINIKDTPNFVDYGEDIDNCPKNTKELKKITSRDVKCSGTFVTMTPTVAKRLMAAGDIASNKITPRDDLLDTDFVDIWWVGDYSDKTGATNGGIMAVKLMNALSTGGLSIQTVDANKGKFAFEFTAHYSIATQDTVPYEVYISKGTDEPAA